MTTSALRLFGSQPQASGPVTRNIHTLDGSQYYELGSTVTLSGDFTVEFIFSTVNQDNQILMGDSHTAAYYFNIAYSTGDFHFRIYWPGGSSRWAETDGTPNVFDGKIHKVKYVIVGSSATLYVDDVSYGSKSITQYTGANSFLIGSSNSITTAKFEGQILYVNINDQHEYLFDDTSTTTVADQIGSNDLTMTGFDAADIAEYTYTTDAAGGGETGWLGAERVINGTFDNWTGDDPDDWTVPAETATRYVTEVAAGAHIYLDGGIMWQAHANHSGVLCFKVVAQDTNDIAYMGFVRSSDGNMASADRQTFGNGTTYRLAIPSTTDRTSIGISYEYPLADTVLTEVSCKAFLEVAY